MNDSSDRSHAARTVVILGAAGYLGSALCRFFHALPDYYVVAISRRKPAHCFFDRHIAADVFAQDWSAKVSVGAPVVLINCAFDFKGIESGSEAGKFAIFDATSPTLRGCPPRG